MPSERMRLVWHIFSPDFTTYILIRVVDGGSREGKFGSWAQRRIGGDRKWGVSWSKY